MRAVRAWFVRLDELVFRRRRDLELAAEMESHLQMHIADGVRSGLAREEARRQAVLALGGIDQTKENYRDRTNDRSFPPKARRSSGGAFGRAARYGPPGRNAA
jgi:hypothetical protein